MLRRVHLCSLFAGVAFGLTGCCGTFRNFAYRIRHCHGCAVGYEGGAPAGYEAGPVMAGPGPGPAPGCATCFSQGGGPEVHGTPGPAPVYTGPIPGMPAPNVFPSMAEPPKPMK